MLLEQPVHGSAEEKKVSQEFISRSEARGGRKEAQQVLINSLCCIYTQILLIILFYILQREDNGGEFSKIDQ